ncbi:hypothetical protein [Stenotrophomonas sp. NPDC077659]|uniref:hypothetical protein n=1 Tax=Stenotrophomonas sp. NPDC077659 TaxID=3390694 RepID=UPI003CFE5CE9
MANTPEGLVGGDEVDWERGPLVQSDRIGQGDNSLVLDKRPLLLCLSLGLFGIGLGTCVTVASSAILGNAPMDKAGMAASIQEVSFELGGALGIAVLGSILAAGFTHSFELPLHPRFASSEGGNVDHWLHIAKNLPAEQGAAVAAAAKEAFQKAFVWVAWTGTGLSLLIAGALAISHSGFKEKSHK